MLSRPMYFGLTLAALAGVGPSCGGAQPSTAPSPLLGTFDFVANTPRGDIRGVLQILPDTVLVDFESPHGSCQVSFHTDTLTGFGYECVDFGGLETFTIAVDRQGGLVGSRWSAGYKSDFPQRVCEDYFVSAQGDTVCTRMATQAFETTEYRSGVLHLRARPSARP